MNLRGYKYGGRFVVIALSILVAGCVGKGRGLKVPNPSKPVSVKEAPLSGINVDFEARARGGSVYIRVRNNTPSLLRVSPYFFALIIDGKYPEIHYHPARAKSEFPALTLASGSEAVGFIHFKDYQNLVGQKMVFNSPDYKPMLVEIKPFE